MAQLATQEEGALARPLAVLIPLIKEDIAQAEVAGMAYYRAAGEKLLEARDGSFDGRLNEFYEWAEKHFGRAKSTIRTWISLVLSETNSGRQFKSLQAHESHKAGVDRSPRIRPPSWQTAVNETARRAFDDAQRLAREQSLTRLQEREADRKLALRLIDIGFKVLARELHPDKGGSRDAMARLNRVRNHLKECI